MTALFPLGRFVATPGALAVLESAGVDPLTLLQRHATGDWGSVPAEDARENEYSLQHGFRILSSYQVEGEALWIISEAGRSVTTVLRPCEY